MQRKPVQLPEVLCDNAMCIGGPNNQFRFSEAKGINTNGCGVLNDWNVALMSDNGGCYGST